MLLRVKCPLLVSLHAENRKASLRCLKPRVLLTVGVMGANKIAKCSAKLCAPNHGVDPVHFLCRVAELNLGFVAKRTRIAATQDPQV